MFNLQSYSSFKDLLIRSAHNIKPTLQHDFNYLGREISTASSCVSRNVKNGFVFFEKNVIQKLVRFIKENWKGLIAFTLAWVVIVTGTGLLYGFSAVAWPLAIGLSCGLGFGLLTGVITKTFIKPNTEEKSIWEFMNSWVNGLDANGTRAIVTSVVVTVVLAATVFFPIAVGSVFGFIMGNHISTKIAYDLNFGHRPGSKINNLKKIEALKVQLSKLENEIKRQRDTVMIPQGTVPQGIE